MDMTNMINMVNMVNTVNMVKISLSADRLSVVHSYMKYRKCRDCAPTVWTRPLLAELQILFANGLIPVTIKLLINRPVKYRKPGQESNSFELGYRKLLPPSLHASLRRTLKA